MSVELSNFRISFKRAPYVCQSLLLLHLHWLCNLRPVVQQDFSVMTMVKITVLMIVVMLI